MSSPPLRYKLVFFSPPSSLPSCKTAIFAAGAGRYPGPGNYTEVCFASTGTSQFKPGEGAKPHIGEVGKLTEQEEVRCEILCVGEQVVRKAVEALKRSVSHSIHDDRGRHLGGRSGR